MSEYAPQDLPIRPVTEGDLDRIEEFFSAMGAESRAFFNRNGWNHDTAVAYCKKPDPVFRYFLAEADGLVAGIVFLWGMNTSIPWLGIAVRDGMQGKHVGRQLIAFAQKYAREQGKGGIQLTTHVANLRGQALYEAMGFQLIGIHGASNEFYYLFRYTDE